MSASVALFLPINTQLERLARQVGWFVLPTAQQKVPHWLVGSKIHLLNLQPGSGYLDTFEWVTLLQPFKDYAPAMQMGVFTTSAAKRDGGLTGHLDGSLGGWQASGGNTV